MQNLPITATPPASPAQQPVSTDSNTSQAAEPFSNVLAARQRANTSAPKADAQGSKQAAPSSASNASPASGNEQANELQTPAPDTASMLPGNMLAALLPALPATDSTASGEKTDPLAPPTPDAITALPADMLAALLPTPVVTNGIAANEKGQLRESAPGKAATLPGDMLATLISTPVALQERSASLRLQPGAEAAVAITAATTSAAATITAATTTAAATAGILDTVGQLRQSSNIQNPQSLSRIQGSTGPAAMTNVSTQGSTFSAALESMGKEGAKAAQLAASAAEFSAQATQADSGANPAIPAQNGIIPIATSPVVPAQAMVNTPVAHEAWGDEFSQKITWLATQHTQSAELHLNPPQLGPLDIVLNVSGDQATALFTSPHAAVRDAVEQALPRLREMLADNGIMLGNAMVSDQSPRGQQAWLADQQQNRSGSLSGKTDGDGAAAGIPSGATILPARRHQGMVDTFA